MFLQEQVSVRATTDASLGTRDRTMTAATTDEAIITDLGIWLSGLESFLATGHQSFAAEARVMPDASREFRLVHAAIQRCSMLTARLMSAQGGMASAQTAVAWDIKFGEIANFSAALRDANLLGDGLIRSNSLGTGEWRAWRNMLAHRLAGQRAFAKLIRRAELEGDKFLPAQLRDLSVVDGFLSPEHAELALVLPRFGRVLLWLSVIGKMLESDEPLKPALLVFARVNEQIFELTNYINNRLERFPDEEAEMFASLDAASYTASIELKKVYSQELSGLADMRQAPSVYARIETAHSLLNEGFQQILARFARLIDPNTDVFKLFPNFAVKLEHSITLRKDLWAVTQLVQKAEAKPEKAEIEAMQTALRDLMKGSVSYLFYKDTETVERFVEEILVTKENKDLVPILHRFGAFLETLFGQVNLRAVLEKSPFDPNVDM